MAALHVAFMAFAAYFGVIIWSTTHEDLLRISPVKLPILDVEVPLTTFYGGVPWLLVLLHYNLLIQLELLSRKLWNLDDYLPRTHEGSQLRDHLFIFPFSHYIAGRSDVKFVITLLSLVVGITVIMLPLFILLAAQIRFLPFHDETITWLQRGAVWFDALMLLALWPLIASSKDQVRQWWLNFGLKLFVYPFIRLRYASNWLWDAVLNWLGKDFSNLQRYQLTIQPQQQINREAKGMLALMLTFPALLLSLIAVIPGSIIVKDKKLEFSQSLQPGQQKFRYFEDLLVSYVPQAWLTVVAWKDGQSICASPTTADPSVNETQYVKLNLTCRWFDAGWFPRNLNLKEARLVPKDMGMALLNRALSNDKATREAAFKEFDGLKLQRRDLRFVDLSNAVLPKADMRYVNLLGADMVGVQLQGADMSYAQLQGANMASAQLQGTNVGEANFQGAYMGFAQLQGAHIGSANLRGAMMSSAQLQGAYIAGSNLQGAHMFRTQLQGAIMASAQLQGAQLGYANLQGAQMGSVNLQGAYMWYALLQGADMVQAQLQGAYLGEAQLQGAFMRETQLQGTNMESANLYGGTWEAVKLDGVSIGKMDNKAWTEAKQRELEAELKPILTQQALDDWQERMKHIKTTSKGQALGKPQSQAGCYSDNPEMLKCPYQQTEQLPIYRAEVLYPYLVKLACSDADIAQGILSRAMHFTKEKNSIDFGLADALIKAAESTKPCPGLAALPEETKRNLQKIAEQ